MVNVSCGSCTTKERWRARLSLSRQFLVYRRLFQLLPVVFMPQRSLCFLCCSATIFCCAVAQCGTRHAFCISEKGPVCCGFDTTCRVENDGILPRLRPPARGTERDKYNTTYYYSNNKQAKVCALGAAFVLACQREILSLNQPKARPATP